MKTIFNKVLGIFTIMGMLASTSAPLVYAAAPSDLGITCDSVSISGNTWTFSGTWNAYDFPGQDSQYDVALFSPTGTVNDSSSKDTPDIFATSQSGKYTGVSNKDDMEGTWSNQIVFAVAPTSVSAALFHQAVPGNESSGDASCFFTLPNTAPVAVADTYSVDEDGTLSVPVAGVLANDSDVDTDPLTAILVAGTTNGTLTLNANGSFVYTPNVNFNGTDTFTYKANDGTSDSNTVTVTITVGAVNDTPTANDDSYSTDEDTVSTGNVLTNDTDIEGSSLSATLVGSPTNGTVTLNADGSFTYTPNEDFVGTDTFTYTASDGSATSNTATVTITVGAVNDVPVAQNDSFSATEDTTLIIVTPGVLANDNDADGNTLSATLVANPTKGTVTLNADGSFTYIPNANQNGTDTFTYKANDGTADSSVAVVTITITPVNDAPTIVFNGSSTETTITVGGTFTDPGATCSDIEDGSSQITGTGTVNTATPGVYTVTYQCVDSNEATSETITTTITVSEAPAQCADGLDNDSDEKTDFPADPGCTSASDNDETDPVIPPTYACSDDIDNDEDGLSDQADPGCHSDGNPENSESYTPTATSEVNAPAPAALCNDGLDNDQDGKTDYPADPGCTSATDNDETDPVVPPSGGGGGAVILPASAPVGQVLGASTSCGIYLDSYLKRGARNNTAQVKKLQEFLNNYLSLSPKLPVTGFFGPQTYAAVVKFQEQENDLVLKPWVGVTLKNSNKGTGYVYKTTKTRINNIMCPELNLPVPAAIID